MPISISEMVVKLDVASTSSIDLSLSGKVAELRRSRSDDRIQQLQSEAIVELYDAVRQIQLAIWPMLAVIPDVSARQGRGSYDDGQAQAAAALHAVTKRCSAARSMVVCGRRSNTRSSAGEQPMRVHGCRRAQIVTVRTALPLMLRCRSASRA